MNKKTDNMWIVGTDGSNTFTCDYCGKTKGRLLGIRFLDGETYWIGEGCLKEGLELINEQKD